jgi:hypothetical protein
MIAFLENFFASHPLMGPFIDWEAGGCINFIRGLGELEPDVYLVKLLKAVAGEEFLQALILVTDRKVQCTPGKRHC